MYRILKDKGFGQTITLENTDTNAQINLGKLSTIMLAILEDSEGLRFGVKEDGLILVNDEWNINIKDETAKKLTERILNSSIKIKTKKIKIKKLEQNKIDAWDVLFGKAKYYND